MRPHCRSRLLPLALLGAFLGAGLSLPASTQARPGFFLGAGLAAQSAAGGLDGTTAFTDPSGNTEYLAGKLAAGTGISLDVGYGFNRWVAAEYFVTATAHTATHALAPSSNAALAAGLLGVRLTAPLDDRLELFVRGGLGAYTASYDSYARTGALYDTGTSETFTGTGYGIGAGAEYLMGHLGLGLGYTMHQATLDRVKASGSATYSLPSSLNVPLSTVDLTFAYHF